MKSIVTSALLLSAVSTINLNAMTLNEALDSALQTNPVILERLKNYDKTVYDLKIAKAEYAPSIDYIGTYGYEKTYDKHTTAGFNTEGFHVYTNTLKLTQNLFNGLGSKYRIKYEKARVMAAAYNYVEKTNDVAFNVVREYINVLKFNSLYKLEQENILLTQDILEKTKDLSDNGAGPLSDVKKVDSSLQLAEFNFLTQKNNLMDAQYNLGKILGKKVNHFDLKELSFDYSLPTSMDEASRHASDFNPSMLVTNYNLKSAQAALVQSRSKFSPVLDFELSYNFDKNTGAEEGHTRAYSALLIVKHNFYRGGADINNVRKSRVNVMQEYETQREIKRQIIEGLQLSWTAYTMIEKQLDFLRSYKNESKATLDLYREEFEDGSRTLIDLLTAQDDYISARNKLITAQYDWLFSKYRILDSMGEMVNTIFKEKALDYYKPTTANYKKVGPTGLPLNQDRDADGVNDRQDLCDNTTLGLEIDIYGCATHDNKLVPNTTSKTVIENVNGEKLVQIEEEVQTETTKVLSSGVNTTFKDDFLANNNGFILNLATFSSAQEVDKFLSQTNLDNTMIFSYFTKNSKKELFKIISGVYETKKSAYDALAKMPRIVKVNKPYLDNIKNVKELYNRNN